MFRVIASGDVQVLVTALIPSRTCWQLQQSRGWAVVSLTMSLSLRVGQSPRSARGALPGCTWVAAPGGVESA